MSYIIEDNIPPPSIGDPSLERLALDELQPGQSILFPAGQAARTASNAAQNKQAKSKTWTFKRQTQPDKSVRIWRLT